MSSGDDVGRFNNPERGTSAASKTQKYTEGTSRPTALRVGGAATTTTTAAAATVHRGLPPPLRRTVAGTATFTATTFGFCYRALLLQSYYSQRGGHSALSSDPLDPPTRPLPSAPLYLPSPTSPTCQIPKWAQHFRQMTLSCGLHLEQETSKSIFTFNRKKKKKKKKKSPDTIYYTVTTYRKAVISKKGARQQQKMGRRGRSGLST